MSGVSLRFGDRKNGASGTLRPTLSSFTTVSHAYALAMPYAHHNYLQKKKADMYRLKYISADFIFHINVARKVLCKSVKVLVVFISYCRQILTQFVLIKG